MRNKKNKHTHTHGEYKRHTAMECLENIRQVHSLAINHSDCVYACTVCFAALQALLFSITKQNSIMAFSGISKCFHNDILLPLRK